MALINDPRMYSGGAVEFDSTPSVNLYGSLMAKRQAKMEAMDEYDRNRINTINPQGLRDVDRQGLDQRLNELRGYYNNNKDKIRGGTTPEAFEYEKMFRNISSYVNQSKERTAKQEAAMKLYQDRLKQDGVIPDDYIKEIELNDKSIDDPSGASFDLPKWLSSPKPFDQQKYLKGFADIKRTAGMPKYEPLKEDPFKMTEIVEETFDAPSKQVMAARAADKYENSFSFRSRVNEEIKDPIRRKELSNIFKEQFGMEASQPEDYATAFTMELVQPKVTKTSTVANTYAKQKDSQAFSARQQAIRERYKNIRAQWRASNPQYANYDLLGKHSDKIEIVDVEEGLPWDSNKKQVQVVPVNRIDKRENNVISSNDQIRPVTIKGKQYWVVDENGNWKGANDQIIDGESVAEAYRKIYPKIEKSPATQQQQKIRVPKDIKQTRMTNKWDKYKSN